VTSTDIDIQKALTILAVGEAIIYPTDTLPGLGVDATDAAAVDGLNNLKGRRQPLSILLHDLDDLEKYVIMKPETRSLAQELLPGPYTLLLPIRQSKLAANLTDGSPLVGVRIPDHDFPRNLVRAYGKPITTTSVNRHGEPALCMLEDIRKQFPNTSAFQITASCKSEGSTIIDCSENPARVVRQGDGIYPL